MTRKRRQAEGAPSSPPVQGDHAYYGSAYHGPGEAGADLGSLIRRGVGMLRRHWLTVLLAGLLGLCGGVYLLLRTTPIYQASSMIEMHTRRPRILNQEGGILEDRATSWKYADSIVNTRLRKLNSIGTRERVAQYLAEQKMPEPSDVSTAEFSLIPESFLVKVSCRHPDPERAAVSANAYAAVTKILAIEENRLDSDSAVAWLETQVATQKVALEAADQAILDFRSHNKLDLLSSRKRTEAAQVMALNGELVRLDSQQLQVRDLCATLQELDVAVADVDKIPPSAHGAELLQQRIVEWRTAQSDREALLAKYRPEHPRVIAADKAIEVQQAKMLKAVARAHTSAQARLHLLERQASSIEQEMETARTQSAELELQIIRLNGQLESLLRVKAGASLSYTGIQRRMEEARLVADENTTRVKLVELAQVPTSPVSPIARRLLMMGLLLGLTIGGGIAFLKEIMDDLVGSSSEIEELLGLRVLGLVPLKKRIIRRKLATACMREGSHLMTETFAGIRALLCSPQYRPFSTSLLITSTAPEEGKTIIASNLAITFARSGLKTLLVDFDLRRPRIEKIFFKMPPEHSLLDILKLDNPTTADFVQLPAASECKNLDVIVSRHDSEVTPAEIMGGSTVEHFIAWAKESYDQVVFDCPPHGLLGDAGVLAAQVDGVLAVCRINQSRRHSLRQAAQHFDDIGANLLGVVANGVPLGKGGSLGSYGYGNRDYYQPDYHLPDSD